MRKDKGSRQLINNTLDNFTYLPPKSIVCLFLIESDGYYS